ncbi:MAG: nucleotidyltransferase domain-containing protein, partial [Candidatus Caldarchaeum sp.]
KLNRYVDKVVALLQPELIMLFGSFASGDVNEGSDVDLLVVAPFQEPFLDRIKLMLTLNQESIPLEPVGYTAEEFEEMVFRRSPFIQMVVEAGRILYKTERGAGILEKAKQLLSQ